MRENRIRKVWAAGGVARNVFLGIPDSFAAEVMANASPIRSPPR